MNIAAMAARNLGGFVPNKIFVGGVPVTLSEEQFRTYFEAFGAISKVELHALRGFGYITYESVDAVDLCLEKYKEHYFGKKWVEVKRSIPRELIDAYEKEQRRLQAELNAGGPEALERTTSGSVKAGLPPKAESGSNLSTQNQSPSVHAPITPASTMPRKPSGGNLSQPPRGEPPGAVMSSRITHLKEMGFSEEVAKRVLAECVWDVNTAIDRLLQSGEMPGGGGSEDPRPGGDKEPTAETPQSQSAWGRPQQRGWGSPKSGDVAAAVSPPGKSPQRGSAWGANAEGGPRSPTAGTPTDAQRTAVHVEAEPVPSAVPAATNAEAVHVEPAPTVSQVHVEVAVQEGAKAPAPEAGTGASANPVKKINRVGQSWGAGDGSQMTVVEGEFVEVWPGTKTEHGWIHGEKLHKVGGQAEAGWLPCCILRDPPDGRRWMKAIQDWEGQDESAGAVVTGVIVTVWVDTKTDQGWTYVEVDQEQVTTNLNARLKPGWLPSFCLEWSA